MRECAASEMGDDHIRHFLFLNGRWRWRPTARMRDAGFRLINLSRGTVVDGKPAPSAEDKAKAIHLNHEWDRRRRGLPALSRMHRYPQGSVGNGYLRALELRRQERESKGVVWTSEQAARDDWPRAWKWIEPLFGACDPGTVTAEQLLELRKVVAEKISESEAHRTVKVWRALWKKMAAFRYCDAAADPSLAFANTAPAPRQAVWSEGEAVRLVKQAWRDGYHGLAAVLAVAWDTQLSPIDARSLRAMDMRQDVAGMWFEVPRAKTGRRAFATLQPRAVRCLGAYLERLGAEPVGPARIFRNRSGQPYSKDTLGDDFRALRRRVFGETEERQLADFRRSGSVEALAGGIQPEKLSSKMANSLSASNRLHKTYAPVQLVSTREADVARLVGRAKLREQRAVESVTVPAEKCHTDRRKYAKVLK